MDLHSLQLKGSTFEPYFEILHNEIPNKSKAEAIIHRESASKAVLVTRKFFVLGFLLKCDSCHA